MGTEQAHLNFVEEASLHITGLGTAAGPGIEFLQYIQPGPGKPLPTDSRTDDIWHWQTSLITEDAGAIYESMKAAGFKIVSNGITTYQGKDGKKIKAFIVRDPDGHAMLVKEALK